MKKLIIPALALLTVFQLQSCKNKSSKQDDTTTTNDTTTVIDHSTSQIALDWNGTYQGTIPCADCEGINTTIKLYDNETFSYNAEYMGKNTTVQDTGKFMWHDNGSVVHLMGKDLNTKYKVGENVLMQLDTEGKQIEGPMAGEYNLKKIQ